MPVLSHRHTVRSVTLSLDAASRPWAAVRFPLPCSWRSRPAPIRVSPRHQAPARSVKPSSSPLMRFTTLIGTTRTDLSAADGRAPGHRQERGRSVADTYDLGGWFTAAGGRRPSEGRVPDVRPEGSGQRLRRSGSLEAIRAATAARLGVTYRCNVASRGRAAPLRHRVLVPVRGCTTTPGGRLVFRVFAALAELIRDSSWRGSRCPVPRPGSTARQWRCWPGLPRTGRPSPRRSRRPAPGAPCRRRPRSHATSDPRFSGRYGGRPRHSLICCWMTSGAGRASTV